jgi:hypothetical protein
VPGVQVAGIDPQPFGVHRDTFWPRSLRAWAIVSVVLVLASIRLVSPTAAGAGSACRSEGRLMAIRARLAAWTRRVGGRRRGSGAGPARSADGSVRTARSTLATIRGTLVGHRRRLWLRRMARRAWLALAWTLAAEAVLSRWPASSRSSCCRAWWWRSPWSDWPRSSSQPCAAAHRSARRPWRSTAKAGSATAFQRPVTGRRAARSGWTRCRDPDDSDEAAADAEHERFVRRQRADAARALAVASPALFRPRFSRRPAAVALVATVLIVPLLILPNAQDAAIAQARANRDEAQKQAARIDEVAKDLERKDAAGRSADARRGELRDLAAELRNHPGPRGQPREARLGRGVGPFPARSGNERRASALTALNRSLSRTASGSSEANPNGDAKQTADDLKHLGDGLPAMTPEQRAAMAAALSALQSAASQADASAADALRDAAQAIAQGQTEAAQQALQRLGDALQGTGNQVQMNRDLANAASRLQETRRALADAGRTAQQGQQGQQGQPGQRAAGPAGQPGQRAAGAGQAASPVQRSRPGSGGSRADSPVRSRSGGQGSGARQAGLVEGRARSQGGPGQGEVRGKAR